MGLRIIGGELRGKKLHSIRGRSIRPTADRLRESIFNIISSCIQGAIVLDLYAGTGAFGIEALSRGAETAVFIDNSKAALSVIQDNIRSCAFDNRAIIVKWDVKRNLNCLKSTRSNAFNLVFLDPPYNRGLIKPSLINLDDSRSLKKEAVIVVEHSSVEPIPVSLIPFKITDQKKYGKTLVSFLNYVV